VIAELKLPPLASRSDIYDVVVLGAGVAGLSAAGTAAAAGARVLVLEASATIGAGATGRNAGILSAGINMGLTDLPESSPHADMWPATTDALLHLVDVATAPDALISATLTGALSLAERPSAARHLAREARARQRLGLRAEMWTPEQVAEATSGRLRTASLEAALWVPDEGRVQPLTLLAHLGREARQAGVALSGCARVVSFEVERSSSGVSRWQLRTEEGTKVRARAVIVAVGPTVTPTARIYALALPAHLPEAFPLFWDAAPYTYCDFRPDHARLVASGGRYGRAGGSPRAHRYYERLAQAARHWLPELGGTLPSHAWAVDLAVAADMIPTLRDLGKEAPGVAIEGLGALGVLPGVVLGQRAGEQLARRLAT
jgi:glycine/D-amino acid oxidase-like deaminating enzyme